MAIMKLYFLTATIIIFTLMGCTSKPATSEKATPTSDFKLSRDYKVLNAKLSYLDTLVIETDLSICMSERYEKLTITQRDSVFYYTMEILDLYNPGKVTLETQHAKAKATWDFGSFLAKNTNRFNTTNARDNDRMRVSCNGDTLRLYTKGLVDANRFLGDYYTTMIDLFPHVNVYGFVEEAMKYQGEE